MSDFHKRRAFLKEQEYIHTHLWFGIISFYYIFHTWSTKCLCLHVYFFKYYCVCYIEKGELSFKIFMMHNSLNLMLNHREMSNKFKTKLCSKQDDSFDIFYLFQEYIRSKVIKLLVYRNLVILWYIFAYIAYFFLVYCNFRFY